MSSPPPTKELLRRGIFELSANNEDAIMQRAKDRSLGNNVLWVKAFVHMEDNMENKKKAKETQYRTKLK